MTNIGTLYQLKKYGWRVFSSREAAFKVVSVHMEVDDFPPSAVVYWSKRYNCDISYIPPNEIVVLLELDGKFKKVLSCNGKIGWTWFGEDYDNCFEEVNQ